MPRCSPKSAFVFGGIGVFGLQQPALRKVCVASAAEGALRVVHHHSSTNRGVQAQPLVFISGLDSAPLAGVQVKALEGRFRVTSICHRADDRSQWESLAEQVAQVIFEELCVYQREHDGEACNKKGVVLVGESFGAALALRVVALCASQQKGSVIDNLVLVNSGTALQSDPILHRLTALLPLLKIDPTRRLLYRAAGILLYRLFLVDERRLDSSNTPYAGDPADIMESVRAWLSRSVDIDAVPLDTMLHRVNLLRKYKQSFSDADIQRLVQAPTTIVASKKDRLLKSNKEAKRLARLLPNVQRIVILHDSAHACLLEGQVSLLDILCEESHGKGMELTPAVAKEVNLRSSPALNSRAAVVGERSGNEQRGEEVAFREALRTARRVLAPWRALTSPVFRGKRHVREVIRLGEQTGRPILFVGNHGVYGLLDMPLLIDELIKMLGGKRLRPLAHSSHFEQFNEISGGRWGPFCQTMGAVPASSRNFYRLLKQGEPILLFPGGPFEVCRRRGQKNKIHWRDDTDFVRPAAKLNAIVVPFSSFGADEAVDVIVDGREMQRLPILGAYITKALQSRNFDTEHVMPLGTPPRPKQMVFEFHQPIDTIGIDPRDSGACAKTYSSIKNIVQDGIDRLQLEASRKANAPTFPGNRLARRGVSQLLSQVTSVIDDLVL